MSDVQKIKSSISSLGGPALGCQYLFTIVPPRAMLNLNSVIAAIRDFEGKTDIQTDLQLQNYLLSKTRQISLLAESVALPGRQILTTEQRLFGTLRKMPYGVLYDDLTVTFICTNSMMERTFFDIWHQIIASPSSQYMEFYDNYIGTIVVQKVSNATDGTNQNLCTYVLMEAYPVSIQSQELNYSDDSYLKLTVQFAYARWKSTLDIQFGREPTDLDPETGLFIGPRLENNEISRSPNDTGGGTGGGSGGGTGGDTGGGTGGGSGGGTGGDTGGGTGGGSGGGTGGDTGGGTGGDGLIYT